MGKAFGYCNDGGVDGAINENQLSLNRVYPQAKR